MGSARGLWVGDKYKDFARRRPSLTILDCPWRRNRCPV